MHAYTATYSPEDNKIRIRGPRFSPEEYTRVRAAGFIWAAKQELWVAPAWSPEREDLALELAGEIDDEDTSLVDRAEERAERFEGYHESRTRDAQSAEARVSSIADNIPLGQPILVGHHSERRARRDAEKIRAGMARACRMWETAAYWTSRAAGAVRAAKYKERPDVRDRRIRTLESELRGQKRAHDKATARAAIWGRLETMTATKRGTGEPTTFAERAIYVAEGDWPAAPTEMIRDLRDGKTTTEAMRDHVKAVHERSASRAQRWIGHLTNRLAYERAMLDASGWTPPPKPKTKADLPLLNYAGEVAFRCPWRHGEIERHTARPMTRAELAAIHTEHKGTRLSECGTHRVRVAYIPKAGAPLGRELVCVYLTDSKTHPRPTAEAVEAQGDAEHAAAAARPPAPAPRTKMPDPARERAAELRQALKAGVQVVSAPNLFHTPPELAARMVREAEIPTGARVLEPSAGTGRILRAIADAERTRQGGPAPHVVAVEISRPLADKIPAHLASENIYVGDFLGYEPGALGDFDRVVMNPPFERGADVNHIRHAFSMLRPGGRLVALCADGPRQRETLQPFAEEMGGTYESLPAGTFADQGTSVNVALLVVDAPAA